ncbi:hypothetical protein SAFG77S_01783 [Streptomyces afghaniensis]|uniref:restriction endonuclease n=1 Tax=Streptomyces afghaniensis TaxID=66865 RepID=UPI0009EA741A
MTAERAIEGSGLCLRWPALRCAAEVGSPDLQRFGGTCFSVHGAHIAAVVTTSVFTRPAAEYAGHHGIRLYDESALAAWATRTGPAPWMP